MERLTPCRSHELDENNDAEHEPHNGAHHDVHDSVAVLRRPHEGQHRSCARSQRHGKAQRDRRQPGPRAPLREGTSHGGEWNERGREGEGPAQSRPVPAKRADGPDHDDEGGAQQRQNCEVRDRKLYPIRGREGWSLRRLGHDRMVHDPRPRFLGTSGCEGTSRGDATSTASSGQTKHASPQ